MAGDVDVLLLRTGGKATGDRNSVLHRHAWHICVLTGGTNLAHDEEWAVALHLDGNIRIADVVGGQCGRDRFLNLLDRASTRCDRADQREGDIPGIINAIAVGEVGMATKREYG